VNLKQIVIPVDCLPPIYLSIICSYPFLIIDAQHLIDSRIDLLPMSRTAHTSTSLHSTPKTHFPSKSQTSTKISTPQNALIESKDDNARKLLHVSVKDKGPGFEEGKSKHLFKPFSQEASSITRKYGGTELGLVLSKHLSKPLGGDAFLSGTLFGKGSTFTFTMI